MCIVKNSREIDVWVLGRTRVRLRAGELYSIQYEYHGKPTFLCLAVSLDPQRKADAPLLTTNTEVRIAPNLRNSASSACKKAQSVASKHENALGPAEKAPPTILRVFLASIYDMGISADDNTPTLPEPLVFSSPTTFDALTSPTSSHTSSAIFTTRACAAASVPSSWRSFVCLSRLCSVIELDNGSLQTYPQLLATRSLFAFAASGIWGLSAHSALENLPVELRGLASGYLIAAVVCVYLGPWQSQRWRALFWVGAGISMFAAYLRTYSFGCRAREA